MPSGTGYKQYDYVVSRDTKRACEAVRELRTHGVGAITNRPQAEAQFEGMRMSGLGREDGRYSLAGQVESQTVRQPR